MRIETHLSSEHISLRRAILLYEGSAGGDAENVAVASLHRVECGQIQPGQPMTSEALNHIYTRLAGGRKTKRALCPANLLCAEGGRLLWHLPATRRIIFFKTGDKTFDAQCNGQLALYPPLLLCAERGRLWVWALKSDARPTEDTPLFNAPFLNVYEKGSVCLGVRAPGDVLPASIAKWEKVFFETSFSHTNRAANKLITFEGGHHSLWRRMTNPRVRTFPVRSLVKDGRTLGDVLNGVL